MRLLSQHKAFEDEMSGRAAHLQQTIKQGDELVADNHFGAEKIKERIQDIQVVLVLASETERSFILKGTKCSLLSSVGTVGGSGASFCSS